MPFILKKKTAKNHAPCFAVTSHLFRYFSLAPFLGFCMTITTVEFLKMTGQLFYRIFVIWIRLLFLHDSGYVFGRNITAGMLGPSPTPSRTVRRHVDPIFPSLKTFPWTCLRQYLPKSLSLQRYSL